MATGTLATKTGAASGSYMAVAPKGDFLYAGSGTNVVAYKIDAATGALTKINQVVSGEVTHISVHPSGKWIFIASWSNNTASVLPIVQGTGAVGEVSQMLSPGMHAHQAVSDASGKFVFVPCPESNYIAQTAQGPLWCSRSIKQTESLP